MNPLYLPDATTSIVKTAILAEQIDLQSTQAKKTIAKGNIYFYCLFVLACVVSTYLCEQQKQNRSVSITYPSMRSKACIWWECLRDILIAEMSFFFGQSIVVLSSSFLRCLEGGKFGTGATLCWELKEWCSLELSSNLLVQRPLNLS